MRKYKYVVSFNWSKVVRNSIRRLYSFCLRFVQVLAEYYLVSIYSFNRNHALFSYPPLSHWLWLFFACSCSFFVEMHIAIYICFYILFFLLDVTINYPIRIAWIRFTFVLICCWVHLDWIFVESRKVLLRNSQVRWQYIYKVWEGDRKYHYKWRIE